MVGLNITIMSFFYCFLLIFVLKSFINLFLLHMLPLSFSLYNIFYCSRLTFKTRLDFCDNKYDVWIWNFYMTCNKFLVPIERSVIIRRTRSGISAGTTVTSVMFVYSVVVPLLLASLTLQNKKLV